MMVVARLPWRFLPLLPLVIQGRRSPLPPLLPPPLLLISRRLKLTIQVMTGQLQWQMVRKGMIQPLMLLRVIMAKKMRRRIEAMSVVLLQVIDIRLQNALLLLLLLLPAMALQFLHHIIIVIFLQLMRKRKAIAIKRP